MTDENTLVAEYEYLAQEHRHHNWLIHTTWYLDIILIASALTYFATKSIPLRYHFLTAVFGLLVFVGLGWHTLFQIQRRENVQQRKYELEAELGWNNIEHEDPILDTWKHTVLLWGFYGVPAGVTALLILIDIIKWLLYVLGWWWEIGTGLL